MSSIDGLGMGTRRRKMAYRMGETARAWTPQDTPLHNHQPCSQDSAPTSPPSSLTTHALQTNAPGHVSASTDNPATSATHPPTPPQPHSTPPTPTSSIRPASRSQLPFPSIAQAPTPRLTLPPRHLRPIKPSLWPSAPLLLQTQLQTRLQTRQTRRQSTPNSASALSRTPRRSGLFSLRQRR